MKRETPTVFAESLLAWTYSTSFPVGIAALIYLRVHFGYRWPFPSTVGLALLSVGILMLSMSTFVPTAMHNKSQVLRWQSIYSNVWISLVGIWLYWRLWGDSGLIILIAVALPLWPLSHREVLRLKER
jgi:hypothetical protein